MKHRDAKRIKEFITKKGGHWHEHSSEAASAPRSPRHRPRSRALSRSECWDWEEVTIFPGEFDIDPW
jgi:hypothetical protein